MLKSSICLHDWNSVQYFEIYFACMQLIIKVLRISRTCYNSSYYIWNNKYVQNYFSCCKLLNVVFVFRLSVLYGLMEHFLLFCIKILFESETLTDNYENLSNWDCTVTLQCYLTQIVRSLTSNMTSLWYSVTIEWWDCCHIFTFTRTYHMVLCKK